MVVSVLQYEHASLESTMVYTTTFFLFFSPLVQLPWYRSDPHDALPTKQQRYIVAYVGSCNNAPLRPHHLVCGHLYSMTLPEPKNVLTRTYRYAILCRGLGTCRTACCN